MKETFRENTELVKQTLSIRDYLQQLGVKIKGNRAVCPICHRPNMTMAIDDVKQVVTCFAGCTSQGKGNSADIIDLHANLNHFNNIEALNDLIKTLNIKRVLPGSIGEIKPVDKKFLDEAAVHINEVTEKIKILYYLKYDILNENNLYEKCIEFKNALETEKKHLKTRDINKKRTRDLYKNAMNFYLYVNRLEITNEKTTK